MLKTMRKQGGFTLIEVVAAAALIGIMATMLLPSLSGANDRVKNARLQNDLVTIDQAIQLYKMDAGTVPAELTTLDSEYLGGKLEFKDAKGEALTYTPNTTDGTYTLSGKNSKGAAVLQAAAALYSISFSGGYQPDAAADAVSAGKLYVHA